MNEKETAWYWFTLGAAYAYTNEYNTSFEELHHAEINNPSTKDRFAELWKEGQE